MLHEIKHQAARYESAEGFSASIKNPSKTISLVEKSRKAFLFYAFVL